MFYYRQTVQKKTAFVKSKLKMKMNVFINEKKTVIYLSVIIVIF
jgi:hypothetical protein